MIFFLFIKSEKGYYCLALLVWQPINSRHSRVKREKEKKRERKRERDRQNHYLLGASVSGCAI